LCTARTDGSKAEIKSYLANSASDNRSIISVTVYMLYSVRKAHIVRRVIMCRECVATATTYWTANDHALG